MKYLVSVLIIAVIIIAGCLLAETPAQAFDSGNYTSVDLEFSDNLTLNINNVTLDTSNMTVDLSPIDETLEDFKDGLLAIIGQFFSFLVVASFVTLAYWNKSHFLQIIASPLVMIYGLLGLTIPSEFASVLWIAGILVSIFGTSMIFKVVWDVLRRKKQVK